MKTTNAIRKQRQERGRAREQRRAHQVHLVIPVNNQATALPHVMAGLRSQTVFPDHVVFVLDRCTDDSRLVLEREAAALPRHIEVTFLDSGLRGEGFFAGRVRDVGIDNCDRRRADALYILLDGDCIPSPGLIEAHVSVLTRAPGPAASSGLILRGGRSGHDPRTLYFADQPKRILYPPLVRQCVVTWTGNLGLNQRALDNLRKANELLSGEPRIFNPAFDSAWGGEDDFIGIALFKGGGELYSLAQQHHAIHVDHPPRNTALSQSRQHRILMEQTARLEELIIAGRLPGEVTNIARLTCPGSADTVLEALNYVSVEAPESVERLLDEEGLATLARREMHLPESIAAPAMKIMLARTKAWQKARQCRCHALMTRERKYGLFVGALTSWFSRWAGPTVPLAAREAAS
jgi:hypothetical protein